MATVQMDLAELELLKKEKNEFEKEIEVQKKLNEGLRVTMAEIKSDKKVLERVRTTREYAIPENSRNLIANTLRAYRHHLQDRSFGPNQSFFKDNIDILAEKIESALIMSGKTISDTEVVNFINASEFKEQLLEKMSSDMVGENARLKAEAKVYEAQLANVQQEHRVAMEMHEHKFQTWREEITANTVKTTDALAKEREESEAEIRASYRAEISEYLDRMAELDKKVEELETGVKHQTEMESLQDKVTKLQEALKKEQSRSFWQKLFGTGSPDTRSLEKVIER